MNVCLLTNNTTGKRYVGMTIHKAEKRFSAALQFCGNKSDSSRSRPISRDGVNWTWIQRLLESGMNAGYDALRRRLY